MRIELKCIVVLACVLFCSNIFSQNVEYSHRLQTWLGVNVKYKVNKRWDVAGFYQQRIRGYNQSNRSRYYFGIQCNYQFSKSIDALFEYRYSTDKRIDMQRFGLGVQKEVIRKRVHLKLRALYQYQLPHFTAPYYNGFVPENRFRLRFHFEIPVSKKWELGISSEPEFRTSVEEKGWQRIRNVVGLKYKLNKRLALELSYINQPSLGNYPRNYLHAGSLQCDINLGKIIKKITKKKLLK